MAAKNTPFLVGLTGQTGAGKTTVSRAFADEGFAVIDCDQVTREVQARPEIIERLAAVFGTIVINDDGTLNRRALAAAAFADAEQTQKLGAIMYPAITEEIDRRIDAFVRSGQNRILLDAPTLFESGIDKRCQKKVAVLAPEDLRLFRIMKRDGISEEQARARMNAQHKDGWYTVRCDYTLRNNSTEEELYKQGKFLAAGLKPQKKKASHEVRTTIIALVLTLGTIAFISGGYNLIYRYMYPQKYSDTVTACAEEFDLDEDLIYAVISCESGFDPDAVSSADAKGLMQLTEDAYDWVKFRLGDDGHSYDDIFDPELNIRYGSCMLSLLLDELGSERSAIAAYHAGMAQVKEWLADPEYSENGTDLDKIPTPNTREYVDKVQNTKNVYENLYD